MIHDITRPDVNGVSPKMAGICQQCQNELSQLLPFISIVASDNLMSSVAIRGTKEKKEEWYNGIFHNGKYFIIHIIADKKRYYEGGKVCAELISKSHKITQKFRKTTGEPEKVIQKVKEWIQSI